MDRAKQNQEPQNSWLFKSQWVKITAKILVAGWVTCVGKWNEFAFFYTEYYAWNTAQFKYLDLILTSSKIVLYDDVNLEMKVKIGKNPRMKPQKCDSLVFEEKDTTNKKQTRTFDLADCLKLNVLLKNNRMQNWFWLWISFIAIISTAHSS